VRHQFLPDVHYQYAGYVAYRGLVNEADLEAEAALFTERFVFYQFPNSHILQYVIPERHESLEPGLRRFNWVWYVNYDQATELPILTDKKWQQRDYSIPPDLSRCRARDAIICRYRLGSPVSKACWGNSRAVCQAILDLGVPQMTFGRVALIGDAAFIPRPHTAAR